MNQASGETRHICAVQVLSWNWWILRKSQRVFCWEISLLSKKLGSKELGSKELGSKELGSKELGSKELGSKECATCKLSLRNLHIII